MIESEWRTKFLNACDEIDRRKAAKEKDAEDLVALRAEVERLREFEAGCLDLLESPAAEDTHLRASLIGLLASLGDSRQDAGGEA